MIPRRAGVFVAAFILAAFSTALALEHPKHKTADAPALHLSPKLRAALISEMNGITEGMAAISGELAKGEWKEVSRRAAQIHDSYIMKQKLSQKELEELVHALPADFIEMDSRFHIHAEGLAHSAKEHNYELAVFYFSKMMEGCGSCHARYAQHIFKGFSHRENTPHKH